MSGLGLHQVDHALGYDGGLDRAIGMARGPIRDSGRGTYPGCGGRDHEASMETAMETLGV